MKGFDRPLVTLIQQTDPRANFSEVSAAAHAETEHFCLLIADMGDKTF